MDAPRFRALVDRLYERTTEGDLMWAEDGDGFILYLTNGAVKITTRRTELGSEDYIITVFNKNSSITDVFEDADIEIRTYDGGLTYYPKMHEMYNMIRRQSTGADTVLRSIMDELG